MSVGGEGKLSGASSGSRASAEPSVPLSRPIGFDPPRGDLYLPASSAVISPCGLFRYRLDRHVQDEGMVAAFFGVNSSDAGPIEDDQTTKKWRGFSLRNRFRRYIAANPFAFRDRDVARLATAADPVGPENAHYVAEIIAEADVLIPCWGRRDKVPRQLRHHFDTLREQLFASGKPILIFGLTDGGDPKHPLMLGYETPLVPWGAAIADTHAQRGDVKQAPSLMSGGGAAQQQSPNPSPHR